MYKLYLNGKIDKKTLQQYSIVPLLYIYCKYTVVNLQHRCYLTDCHLNNHNNMHGQNIIHDMILILYMHVIGPFETFLLKSQPICTHTQARFCFCNYAEVLMRCYTIPVTLLNWTPDYLCRSIWFVVFNENWLKNCITRVIYARGCMTWSIKLRVQYLNDIVGPQHDINGALTGTIGSVPIHSDTIWWTAMASTQDWYESSNNEFQKRSFSW